MPVHTEIYPQRKQNPTLFCCTSSGDKENNIMSYDDKKEQRGGQQLTLLATGPLLCSSSPDVRPATRIFSFESIVSSLLLMPSTSCDPIHVDGLRSRCHDSSSVVDEFSVMLTHRSRPAVNASFSVMPAVVLTLWYINKEDELEMFQVWNVERKT